MAGKKIIAFQGENGANSHVAALELCPDRHPLACKTFQDVFAAVQTKKADEALVPVENLLAGRVADIHHLLPPSGLSIIAEFFLHIHHQLLGLPSARLQDIQSVHSQEMALLQCRASLHQLQLDTVPRADTAGAARAIAQDQDPSQAAVASALAAQLYGLKVLRANIEDSPNNITRFLLLSREAVQVSPKETSVLTSLTFQVRNVPAALYKALGGFATNGVNMTRLESGHLDDDFSTTHFYADIEGHPEHRPVRLALEELTFFSKEMRLLGVYKAARPRS